MFKELKKYHTAWVNNESVSKGQLEDSQSILKLIAYIEELEGKNQQFRPSKERLEEIKAGRFIKNTVNYAEAISSLLFEVEALNKELKREKCINDLLMNGIFNKQ